MKKIFIGLLGLCMLLGLNSCVKANAGTVSAPSNGYSVQRVYFDPTLGFRIYKVKTPTGTFEVLLKTDKGGLCVLQRV